MTVYFVSEVLAPSKRNYLEIEKVLYAILMALTKSFGTIMKELRGINILGTYFDVPEPQEVELISSIMQENKLGRKGQFPTTPCQVYQSLHDQVVPYKTTDDLMVVWSARGARIDYVRDQLSNHVVLCFTGTPLSIRWMQARFEGEPTIGQPGKPSIETVITILNTNDASSTLGEQRKKEMYNLLAKQYIKSGLNWWT